MKKFIIALLIPFSSVWANLHLAPADFNTSHGRAIFVDFQSAEYNLNYNFYLSSVIVKSKIEFISTQNGKPIFDLVPFPLKVKLNGQKVGFKLVKSPDGKTKVRIANKAVLPGKHTLEVTSLITRNVLFNIPFQTVSSAFWIRDLKDRMFLEQYVPSNFEYDQYKMIMNIKFDGLFPVRQDFYTNGEITQTSPRSWRIEFPEYYTASCPFFHTTAKGRMKRRDFNYKSISGREISITVYSPFWRRTNTFRTATKKYMAELEADYGPWAHPKFVAYGTITGTGGMEHAGATVTSIGALDHEMIHSYFAKGIMPANGNAGWIDEAIASWRDKGYPRYTSPGFVGSDMGAKSMYSRKTDKRAYSLGADFLAYLDYRLQNMGGLKAFLKSYFAAYKHTVITTEHFKNNLEFFSGLNFQEEFWTYIWGKNPPGSKIDQFENPVHKELSEEVLDSLL